MLSRALRAPDAHVIVDGRVNVGDFKCYESLGDAGTRLVLFWKFDLL